MSYEDEIYEIYKKLRDQIPDHALIRKLFLSILKECDKRYQTYLNPE